MSEGYFLAKDRWTTRAGEWSLYAIAWILRCLTWPLPTKWFIAVAGTVGGGLMMAVPSVRRRALRNLELIWPERPLSERKAIARGAAQQFCVALEAGLALCLVDLGAVHKKWPVVLHPDPRTGPVPLALGRQLGQCSPAES